MLQHHGCIKPTCATPSYRMQMAYLQCATQLVDDHGGQGLLLDVLCHDHEGEGAAHSSLQDAHDVARCGDLFVHQQQLAVVKLRHLSGQTEQPSAWRPCKHNELRC